MIIGLTFVWRSVPTRHVRTLGRQLFGHARTDENSIPTDQAQIRNRWTGLALAVSGLTLQLVSFWI
jgi:hypothetical protein